jgi:hypothetical protein
MCASVLQLREEKGGGEKRRRVGRREGGRKLHGKLFAAEINVFLKVVHCFPITRSDGSFLSA